LKTIDIESNLTLLNLIIKLIIEIADIPYEISFR